MLVHDVYKLQLSGVLIKSWNLGLLYLLICHHQKRQLVQHYFSAQFNFPSIVDDMCFQVAQLCPLARLLHLPLDSHFHFHANIQSCPHV